MFLRRRQTLNLGSFFSPYINCMLCELLFFIKLCNYILLPWIRITLTLDQSHLASFSITIPKQRKPTRKKLTTSQIWSLQQFPNVHATEPSSAAGNLFLPNVFVVVFLFSFPPILFSEFLKCFFLFFFITYVTTNHR